MTTTVRERPILFSGDMVRALLAGTKTQTRRVVKPQPAKTRDYAWISGADPAVAPEDAGVWLWEQRWESHENSGRGGEYFAHVRCPFGEPGDGLWVRESHFVEMRNDPEFGTIIYYRADEPYLSVKWTPSIHMPRWASRLSLEITDVRVERVQSISYADAMAEGVDARIDPAGGETNDNMDPFRAYARLWDALNAARGFGWDANPWCWCITFKRVEG